MNQTETLKPNLELLFVSCLRGATDHLKEQTRLNQVEGPCDLFIIQYTDATNSSVIVSNWGSEKGG